MKTVKLGELKAGVTTDQADNMLEVVSTEDLSIGEHTFSLIVFDSSGNESKAATVTIKVLDTTAPTAILSVLNSDRLPTETVEWGSTFFLSAEGSTDTPSAELGGDIVRYVWTLVSTG